MYINFLILSRLKNYKYTSFVTVHIYICKSKTIITLYIRLNIFEEPQFSLSMRHKRTIKHTMRKSH